MARKSNSSKGKAQAREASAKRVRFQLRAPHANEVFFVGDINQWNASANPMKKDSKGIWKTTLYLKPGKYEYRFIVDGDWANDPACSSCVANEFGSENCVRVVE